jgi:hypothetical protein
LLDAFLAQWFGADLEDGGIPAAELREAERRLGFALPAALDEWYERYGNLNEVWCRQDSLRPPSKLSLGKSGLLTFCVENQSVVRWAIRRSDLPLDDPPVVLDDFDTLDGPIVECDTTSGFALLFAAMNAKWSGAVRNRANGQVSRSVLSAIEAKYPRLPFQDAHWPEFPTRFHGNDDILLESNGDRWLWVTARARDAFDELDDLVQRGGRGPNSASATEWVQVERE